MLVLASASPRRHELLAQAGFSFTVHPAHIPEDPLPNEDPIAYVTRLAREKAQAVFHELALKLDREPALKGHDFTACGKMQMVEQEASGHDFSRARSDSKNAGALAPEGILSETLAVLAADTTVTLDNQILGKPSGPADAARMLRLLSGRTHQVITGVALLTATSSQVASESTSVTFRALTEQEIAAYIATGEPLDKAGAYAIQGRAARWIPRIEGDYFNVVGLPIALVSALLESVR
ncbi:MAG: Maf family protein [Terracidiphilus sp.]|jgi:septum formation protein